MGVKFPISSGISTADKLSFNPDASNNILKNQVSVQAALEGLDGSLLDDTDYRLALGNGTLQTGEHVPDMSVINTLNNNLTLKIPCGGTTGATNEIYFDVPNTFNFASTEYDVYIEFGSKTYGLTEPEQVSRDGNRIKATYTDLADTPVGEYYIIVTKV